MTGVLRKSSWFSETRASGVLVDRTEREAGSIKKSVGREAENQVPNNLEKNRQPIPVGKSTPIEIAAGKVL